MSKKKNNPVNVVFSDEYVGCQVVANLMKLNVETVRKRAKAGKLPAKQNENGVWIFKHADLVAAGVHPFSTSMCSPPQQQATKTAAKKKNVTYVYFVLDRSGSMASLMSQARDNLMNQVQQLDKASGPNDEYRINVVAFDDTVSVTCIDSLPSDILRRSRESLYPNSGGYTAILDAVDKAADLADQIQINDSLNQAFLISIITDGGENASKASVETIKALVETLNKTDKYTFAYAGPKQSERFALSIGLHQGNITTWEQSFVGVQTLGATSTTSMNSYISSRAVGATYSTSFYAQPVVTNAAAFASKLDNTLNDVSAAVKVTRVDSKDPLVVSKFCEQKLGQFKKGSAFYELTESEKVQDYKKVVIQDKTTGKFYEGWDSAKKLLGIPNFQGTVHIKPGSLGDFKVFIQSTSVNRKLTPGTAVLYLG